MSKYKVLQVCYDFENRPPYFDELSQTHSSRDKAEIDMYKYVLDELDCLNGIMEGDAFPERRFIATIEDKEYDVVVNAWDGPDYRPVTCYKVITVDELVEFFNAKLRDDFGEDITVKICSYEECDGSTQFYYTTTRNGDIYGFETATQAYSDAGIYLSYVGELW